MSEPRTGPEMGNPGTTDKDRGTPAMKPKRFQTCVTRGTRGNRATAASSSNVPK